MRFVIAALRHKACLSLSGVFLRNLSGTAGICVNKARLKRDGSFFVILTSKEVNYGKKQYFITLIRDCFTY